MVVEERSTGGLLPAAPAPAQWWLGPPPPRALTWLARALQLAVATVMLTWVLGYLGGLGFTPRPLAGGANDTGPLFNWHPLLLTLAFPLLMAEAVLAYKAPLVERPDRDASKKYHALLHTAALVCIGLGVAAAFASHTLKRPTPIPNLYSAHSWLGMAVLALLAVQFSVGAYSYLWPTLLLADRQALGPLHRFLGKAVFVGGTATMAVGIQEKATFVQAFAKPASLRSAVMALPAALIVLLLLTTAAVLYHHAPPAPAQQLSWRQGEDREAAEGEVLMAPSPRAAAAAEQGRSSFDELHTA